MVRKVKQMRFLKRSNKNRERLERATVQRKLRSLKQENERLQLLYDAFLDYYHLPADWLPPKVRAKKNPHRR